MRPARLKSAGQASRLETQARFLHWSLEFTASWLKTQVLWPPSFQCFITMTHRTQQSSEPTITILLESARIRRTRRTERPTNRAQSEVRSAVFSSPGIQAPHPQRLNSSTNQEVPLSLGAQSLYWSTLGKCDYLNQCPHHRTRAPAPLPHVRSRSGLKFQVSERWWPCRWPAPILKPSRCSPQVPSFLWLIKPWCPVTLSSDLISPLTGNKKVPDFCGPCTGATTVRCTPSDEGITQPWKRH